MKIYRTIRNTDEILAAIENGTKTELTGDEVDFVTRALSDPNGAIEIRKMNHYFDGSTEWKFGINWSAIGTVETDKAQEFHQELTEAIANCEMLNSRHLKIAD